MRAGDNHVAFTRLGDAVRPACLGGLPPIESGDFRFEPQRRVEASVHLPTAVSCVTELLKITQFGNVLQRIT